MPAKLTQAEFVRRASVVHLGRYLYDETVYAGAGHQVEIRCPFHGLFRQSAKRHLFRGAGCPKCRAPETVQDTASFVEQARRAHGDLFSYKNSVFTTARDKISITCKLHGDFLQTPLNHIHNEQGCPKCAGRLPGGNNTSGFITRATAKHGDQYDYSKTVYDHAHAKVCITCKTHGDFWTRACDHISTNKRGCPQCSESKGERKVAAWLESSSIPFIRQHTFKGCRSRKGWTLRFDFWIPSKNIAIEFDGIQHSKPTKFSRLTPDSEMNSKFELQVAKDKVKTDYCASNDIRLIRISHDQIDMTEVILADAVA